MSAKRRKPRCWMTTLNYSAKRGLYETTCPRVARLPSGLCYKCGAYARGATKKPKKRGKR